jgi:hypothetical protein
MAKPPIPAQPTSPPGTTFSRRSTAFSGFCRVSESIQSYAGNEKLQKTRAIHPIEFT